jgi:hypothetical protein
LSYLRKLWIVRFIRHQMGLDSIRAIDGGVRLKATWWEQFLYDLRKLLRRYWWVPVAILGIVGLIWLMPYLINVLSLLASVPWVLVLKEVYASIPNWVHNLLGAVFGGLMCRMMTWLSNRSNKRKTLVRR